MVETALSIAAFGAAFLMLGYMLLSPKRLRRKINARGQGLRQMTSNEIGVIEEGLPHLARVIIMCDRVEAPQDALRKAVERNFDRNVKYIFLVSNRHAKTELKGYVRIFEALAEIHLARSRTNGEVGDLVEIQRLAYDWNDYPYIFYQMEDGDTVRTVAYRGNERCEGIASLYEEVDPQYAHTIALATLADGPQPIRDKVTVAPNQFTPHLVKVERKENVL